MQNIKEDIVRPVIAASIVPSLGFRFMPPSVDSTEVRIKKDEKSITADIM